MQEIADRLLFWSDNKSLYMVISLGLLSLLVILSVLPALAIKKTESLINRILIGESLYICSLFAFVFSSRWPSLFWYKGYSIDEDQFLSATWTLLNDPVFFRSVEAGSSGPFNIYPMMGSIIFGVVPSLISIRIIALGITCSFLALTYVACRQVVVIQYARTGMLVPVIFFGMAFYWDFSGYSSELPSILYLSGGLACAALIFNIKSSRQFIKSVWLAFAGGLILSLVLLAKLQAVYLALLTGAVLLLAIVYNSRLTPFQKYLTCSTSLAGSLFVPIVFTLIMWWCGSLNYFFNSYFLNALAYVDAGYVNFNPFIFIWGIVQKAIDFQIIFLGWGLVMTVCLAGLIVQYIQRKRIRGLSIFLISLVFVLLAFYTVISPRRDWPHYLLFLPVYFGVSLCLLMQILDGIAPQIRSKSLYLTLFVISFCVLPLGFYRMINSNPYAGQAHTLMPIHSSTYSPVGGAILRAASSEKSLLCVWGYNPDYHTETKLTQSTRLSISSGIFNQNNLQSFFQETYVKDILQAKPEIFVDATATNQFPALNDPLKYRHEVIPEIRDFVALNYTLFDTIDGVRIYRWKQ